MPERGSKPQSPTFQAGNFNHCGVHNYNGFLFVFSVFTRGRLVHIVVLPGCRLALHFRAFNYLFLR